MCWQSSHPQRKKKKGHPHNTMSVVGDEALAAVSKKKMYGAFKHGESYGDVNSKIKITSDI